jgi:hypothetical protein
LKAPFFMFVITRFCDNKIRVIQKYEMDCLAKPCNDKGCNLKSFYLFIKKANFFLDGHGVSIL